VHVLLGLLKDENPEAGGKQEKREHNGGKGEKGRQLSGRSKKESSLSGLQSGRSCVPNGPIKALINIPPIQKAGETRALCHRRKGKGMGDICREDDDEVIVSGLWGLSSLRDLLQPSVW